MGLGEFLRERVVIYSIALQVVLAFTLAHGYDFRVSYVAGRNIALGSSPYEGGEVSGGLAVGYGTRVQGLGETPLWALVLGASYSLASGHVMLFNIAHKAPLVVGNVAASYLLYSRGAGGWRFFLLNPFLLMVTTAWGKPDLLASLAAVLSLTLLARGSLVLSTALLSLSLMIKPLAVAIAPAYIGTARGRGFNDLLLFLALTTVFSTALFLSPFILLKWPLETVVRGFGNWFSPAGGITLYNVVEIYYDRLTLPEDLWWAGLTTPASLLLLTAYYAAKPPRSVGAALRAGVLSASVFFSVRPWVSEQNLVLLLLLLSVLEGRAPDKPLWVIPLVFMFFNTSVFQLFYLMAPSVISVLVAVDQAVRQHRLWGRLAVTLAWYAALWVKLLGLVRRC